MEILSIEDHRYERLGRQQFAGLQSAQFRVLEAPDWDDEKLVLCDKMITRGKLAGTTCKTPAGAGTIYDGLGAGPCWWHRGNRQRGRAETAWVMAHRFASELDCSPWDGLLQAVRIAAGKVAYCEWVLSQALDDREFEGRMVKQTNEDGTFVLQDPDTGEMLSVGSQAYRDRSWWVIKGELWVDRLAKYSKLAIDAGVAERLVEVQVLQAQMMARPLEAALSALGLTHEQEVLARSVMEREIMALSAEGVATIDGQLSERIPND